MNAYVLTTLVLFAIALGLALVVNTWRDAVHRPALAAEDGDLPMVTLIVPARDEETNIAALLQDLFAQRYPQDRMQVIVVDDGSSDRTAERVRAMLPRWPALQLLTSQGIGKKAAITTGVRAARGALVILSDADVRCGPDRVRSVVSHWQQQRSDLIVLPVWTKGSGPLGRLQECEQALLLGMAIGTASQDRAVLAYGANLAFRPEAFAEVGGFEGDRFASGDDHFLLQRMRRKDRKITAYFDGATVVTAYAAPSFKAFIVQRLRWAGKMRGAGVVQAGGGLFVLLFPWYLLWHTAHFDLVTLIGQHALFTTSLLIGAWACLVVPSIMLAASVRRKFGRGRAVIASILGLVALHGYAPIIAVVALIVRPKWKGRPLVEARH